MDESKIERFSLEDGRRAERHVYESQDCSGEGERVTELFTEEERPVHLQERLVEKTKPFVYHVERQKIDKDGNIIERKVESSEEAVPLRLVEHIGLSSHYGNKGFAAQSVKEDDDCDCHVTKEEMIDTIIAAMKATQESKEQKVSAMSFLPGSSRNKGEINSLGLADEITKRQETKSSSDQVLWGAAIIAEVLVIVAVILFF